LPRPGGLVVETLFKYHAAYYLTHSSIEAIKLLRRQLSFSGPDAARIDIDVAQGRLSGSQHCRTAERARGMSD
jgi:hypothetical protein